MRSLFLTLAGVALLSSTAHAQYYYYPAYRPPPWIAPKFVRGSLALSGFGSIVVAQNGTPEYVRSGGGLGIDLGLDFGRFVGIRLGYDISFHNPEGRCGSGTFQCNVVFAGVSYLVLETIHADFVLHIPTGTRFQPLFTAGVLAGLLGRASSPTDSVGGGFEAGLGFDVWISRWATFGVVAKYRGIDLGDFSGNTDSGSFLSLVNVAGNIAVQF
jgi:hypothetical protein